MNRKGGAGVGCCSGIPPCSPWKLPLVLRHQRCWLSTKANRWCNPPYPNFGKWGQLKKNINLWVWGTQKSKFCKWTGRLAWVWIFLMRVSKVTPKRRWQQTLFACPIVYSESSACLLTGDSYGKWDRRLLETHPQNSLETQAWALNYL